MVLKRCSKCGVEKPLEEFHKAKGYRDGYKSFCKICIHIKNQTYFRTHKKQIAINTSKYQRRNRERVNAINRRYYTANKEKINDRQRKYRLTDSGKFADRRGKHKRRALAKTVENNLTVEQWNNILDIQHNQCNICHKVFNKKRCATIDHITPLSRGGGLTVENVQALCGSCNSVKHNKLDFQFIQTWLWRNKR